MVEQTETGGVNRWGLLVFVLALLAVAGVIGWRFLQETGETQAPAAAPMADASIDALLAQTRSNPDDPEAWQTLGYAQMERADYDGAATAFTKATERDDGNADLWSALGEALVRGSTGDPIPARALSAFRKAVEIEPSDPRARYFLAVKQDIDGNHESAINALFALLDDTPPGAPWEGDLVRTIQQIAAIREIPVDDRLKQAQSDRALNPAPAAAPPALTAGDAIPGPSRQQIDAARTMAPGDQRDMAVGMVESLEGKLAANPVNVDGWVMLMRSRMTLGEPEKASKALADGIAANPESAERLQTEAQVLGVP